MTLRCPTEEEVNRRGADEGEGHGFDNLDTSAYAERVFRCEIPFAQALDWYAARLLAHGWRLTSAHDDVRQFTRDDDEFVQVQVLPLQETAAWSWSSYYGRAGPFARISFSVSDLH